jgi:DNA-binding CsgD family transcriptional regulator/urease accessory protein UreF
VTTPTIKTAVPKTAALKSTAEIENPVAPTLSVEHEFAAPTLEMAFLPQEARQLLEQLRETQNPFSITLVAPSGYGKTTFIAELARRYRELGIATFDAASLMADEECRETRLTDNSALLLDDAHRLTEAELSRLRDYSQSRFSRVILTHPPYRETPLEDLFSTKKAFLPPLGAEQIRQLAGGNADLAREIHAYTGGVPQFVRYALRIKAAEHNRANSFAGQRHPENISPARVNNPLKGILESTEENTLKLLIAIELGAARNFELIAQLLHCGQNEVASVIEGARAQSLIDAHGQLLPISRAALRTVVPVERRSRIVQELATIQLTNNEPLLTTALALMDDGSRGPTVATALRVASKEAVTEPLLAAKLISASAKAGEPRPQLLADWARFAALSGDWETASRLSEEILADENPEHHETGLLVSATVLAHRGELARSAEMYQWSSHSSAHYFAAIGLIASGQVEKARLYVKATADNTIPTIITSSAKRVAEGIEKSLSHSANDALAILVNAAALIEPMRGQLLLPDSPAALAAIAALHCGELKIAESLLCRALSEKQGGPFLTARHRLLLGWTCMIQGDLDNAKAQLGALAKTSLESRDELFRSALELGLARRQSDLPALRKYWEAAYQAVMRHPVDLFSLLPLGEITVVAARLGELSKLAGHLQQAQSLMDNLGNPPLWSTMPLWNRLHAAILKEDKEFAEKSLSALEKQAHYSPHCSMLFSAAENWVAVLSGNVDTPRVVNAANGLDAGGMHWDAARLAGQAAIRTSDRAAMITLLETARQFSGSSRISREHNPSADSLISRKEPSASARGDVSSLSEREQEVANLVITGLTYKQIGEKLFISSKTVEHHVARIRGKLGSSNRRELLETLRELLHVPQSPQ